MSVSPCLAPVEPAQPKGADVTLQWLQVVIFAPCHRHRRVSYVGRQQVLNYLNRFLGIFEQHRGMHAQSPCMHAQSPRVNVNAIGNAGLNQNPCGYETKVETKGDKPDAG